MFNKNFRIRIVFIDTFLDGISNTACHAITAARAGRIVNWLLGLVSLHVDSFCLKNGGQLLKRNDEIYIAPHRFTGCLKLFRRTRPDENNACIRMLLFNGTRRGNHRRQRTGYRLKHILWKRLLREHGPCRTTGCQQEWKLAGLYLMYIVPCLRNRPNISAQRNLVYF